GAETPPTGATAHPGHARKWLTPPQASVTVERVGPFSLAPSGSLHGGLFHVGPPLAQTPSGPLRGAFPGTPPPAGLFRLAPRPHRTRLRPSGGQDRLPGRGQP